MKHRDIINKHRSRLKKLAQVAPAKSVEVVSDASPIYTGAFIDSINLNVGSIDKSFKSYGTDPIFPSEHYGKIISAQKRAVKNSKRANLNQDVYVTDSVKHNMKVEYTYGYRPFGLARNAWQNTVNEAVKIVSA